MEPAAAEGAGPRRLEPAAAAGARRVPALAVAAIAVLAAVVVAALVRPWVDPEPLGRVDLGRTFLPPIWSEGGTWRHPLGTDQLGRDVFTRLAYGARLSLLVAVTAAGLSAIVGTAVGLLTGYFEGWIDVVASRVIEAQLSLPLILVALALVVGFGASVPTLIAAIAISTWVPYARVVRSEVLVLRRSDFVALSIVTGLRPPTILWRHVLPNVLPSVIVLASQSFGQAIIYEASLSYLGLAVQPPGVSWGLMIAQARIFLSSRAWLVLAPALALAVTALAANILGDLVRDRLDPTLEAAR
jgi:peptide/nickel transport system permease protein